MDHRLVFDTIFFMQDHWYHNIECLNVTLDIVHLIYVRSWHERESQEQQHPPYRPLFPLLYATSNGVTDGYEMISAVALIQKTGSADVHNTMFQKGKLLYNRK